jgi:hypothetical protein
MQQRHKIKTPCHFIFEIRVGDGEKAEQEEQEEGLAFFLLGFNLRIALINLLLNRIFLFFFPFVSNSTQIIVKEKKTPKMFNLIKNKLK